MQLVSKLEPFELAVLEFESRPDMLQTLFMLSEWTSLTAMLEFYGQIAQATGETPSELMYKDYRALIHNEELKTKYAIRGVSDNPCYY